MQIEWHTHTQWEEWQRVRQDEAIAVTISGRRGVLIALIARWQWFNRLIIRSFVHTEKVASLMLSLSLSLSAQRQTKDSSVETMIMVHENREILTHNSRRFLVVCQFNPETYTFTASVDVPSHLLKRKKMTSNTSNVTSTATGTAATIGSSSGPTGTKPLTNSKEYSFDEKLVSSFQEYATASSPSTVHSRTYASSGSGASSLLNNRDSRSNIFKLRLPLHPVPRVPATPHSHSK